MLASASEAVIVGFETTVEQGARQMAEREGVTVRNYDIIYNHGLAALRGDESIPDALQAMEKEANETFNE